MKDFMDKWNNDSKFKTKIKLGLYTLFVVFVAIFAISNRDDIPTNTVDFDTNYNDSNNDIDINENDTVSIEIPEKYKYTKNIKIDEKKYQYTGTKENEKENITKLKDDVTTNYIYQNNNYYKEENGSYILTTKDEIYDIVGSNYMSLETINQYLSKSVIENNRYLVYLKDIILGNDSEEYIIISIEENKVNIDYTSLMKLFDKSIEKYLIEVIIEEIE